MYCIYETCNIYLHHQTITDTKMKTSRIISEESLNKVLGVNQRLEPSQWDAIKDKLGELGNNELKEFSSLMNPVIKMLSKQILLERGAIKL